MPDTPVAVVTGANKGIGFAIVRALCKQFFGDVYLTSRDIERGKEAVAKLQKEGLKPLFHQLDITDLQSIRTLRDFLKEKYGGLDVLVNNAGIAFKVKDTTPFAIQAEVTLRTNFFATRDVCTELLPLLQPNGRVVNVSSMSGVSALSKCNQDLQKKFHSDTITEEELGKLMEKFVEDTKKGVHEKEGWPNTAYGVSEIGIIVLSRIQARRLNETRKGDGILLNACCPGWVRTDMAGPDATKSPDEGAVTPVYLALLPPGADGPNGQLHCCFGRHLIGTMPDTPVAVVTGANKGIGFAIVRALCKQFPGNVYLTSRDIERGKEAVAKLQKEGLKPLFHQLDITDLQSIHTLRDFLKEKYGGLDVLVNNAGIAFKVKDTTPFAIQAEVTLRTNFFATRDVCTELLPLLQPNARVVNVSSMSGASALSKCNQDLQKKFRSDTITEEELVKLMEKFVEDTKKGVHKKEGWPSTAYGVSKIGVTVLSRIQARRLNETRKGDGILLNACCPGWVRTDMTGPEATKSPDEGAETPVYLALLPTGAKGPHGQYISEKRIQKW